MKNEQNKLYINKRKIGISNTDNHTVKWDPAEYKIGHIDMDKGEILFKKVE